MILRVIQFLITLFVVSLLLSVASAQTEKKAPWQNLPRVMMQEEDSHPHEIPPRKETRFHTGMVDVPSVMYVKCSLTGPAAFARVIAFGMELKDWPLQSRKFDIPEDETLWFDIIGVVQPNRRSEPYFAFQNLDPNDLLWHQCYNNAPEE